MYWIFLNRLFAVLMFVLGYFHIKFFFMFGAGVVVTGIIHEILYKVRNKRSDDKESDGEESQEPIKYFY